MTNSLRSSPRKSILMPKSKPKSKSASKPKSKPTLHFKDGRTAKVGETVTLKNGAHVLVEQRKDSVGHPYAALKFVSPTKQSASKTKKSASKTKQSPSPKNLMDTVKSGHHLTRNDFCF